MAARRCPVSAVCSTRDPEAGVRCPGADMGDTDLQDATPLFFLSPLVTACQKEELYIEKDYSKCSGNLTP